MSAVTRVAALYDVHGNLPALEHVSTSYDVARAVAALRATGCPETDSIVRNALVEPWTAEAAMAEFERMRRGESR